MTRRFLTADDVRRSVPATDGAGEIVVDEETVVTPQALEAAAAAGLEIRTSAGAYREPPPDRGPDAERAVRALPHLPEPKDDAHAGATVVVTAVGQNRNGVLAEITTAVGATGGNVESVSQRVVEGHFHLILVVTLEPGRSFEEMKGCLDCLGGPEDYAVHMMHERVYRFMHRV
jgi:predicted amino acid-binding ACT domain protein